MSGAARSPPLRPVAREMAESEADFSLRVVLASFQQCLTEAEEVQLDHYLAGWRGLVRCVRGARRRP